MKANELEAAMARITVDWECAPQNNMQYILYMLATSYIKTGNKYKLWIRKK